MQALSRVIRSWAWKKFMSGWSVRALYQHYVVTIHRSLNQCLALCCRRCSVILLPIAITFYTTWWFIRFVDGFFSPIYIHLGIHLFGTHVDPIWGHDL